jgi:aminopeptidase N
VAELKRSRDAVFTAEKKIPGVAVRHDNLSDMKKVLNVLVYQKGAWILHMLRARIGEENFWAGIRDYYSRYRDGSASTDDFRKVMEENSGVDLGWFLEQWLNRPGSPDVEGHWRYDADAKKIVLELVQKQPGEAYRLPFEIAVFDRIEKIEMVRKEQKFELASEKEPASLALDPNTLMLMSGAGLHPGGRQRLRRKKWLKAS